MGSAMPWSGYPGSRMSWATRRAFFLAVAAVCAAGALFFGYYGARVLHYALTFEGEGSLGHVGMYLAAGLLPFLALFCGALAHLAWKQAGRLNRPPADA